MTADEDMTEDEFDARMAAGQPVLIVGTASASIAEVRALTWLGDSWVSPTEATTIGARGEMAAHLRRAAALPVAAADTMEPTFVAGLYARDQIAAERYVTDRLTQASMRLLAAPADRGAREHMQAALDERTELRRLQKGVAS